MSLLYWTENLNVGIDLIDQQHKEMFKLANTFYDDLYKGADKISILVSLNELIEFTVLHFRTEEIVIIQNNLEVIPKHREEHSEFVNKLLSMFSRIQSGNLNISVDDIEFLRNSIINHIFVADKDMANCILSL